MGINLNRDCMLSMRVFRSETAFVRWLMNVRTASFSIDFVFVSDSSCLTNTQFVFRIDYMFISNLMEILSLFGLNLDTQVSQ